VLLQVMDYGVLTDNAGRKADFRNVIIIMTSNAGARELGRKLIGFDQKAFNKSAIEKEVERVFSPEFRNRLDEIAVFNPIDDEMAKNITVKALREVAVMLSAKGVEFSWDDEAVEYIAKKGFNPAFGAREIARIVDKEVKKKLAERVLFGECKDSAALKLENGELAVV